MTTDFSSLNLRDEITQAITELGYSEPTPIQAGMIPVRTTNAPGAVISGARNPASSRPMRPPVNSRFK